VNSDEIPISLSSLCVS